MTTYTANFNLGKQEDKSDKFSMDNLNTNFDKIDTALAELKARIEALEPTDSGTEETQA